MQFINSFYAALNNYEPQPYPGDITLFLSQDWYCKPSIKLEQLKQCLEKKSKTCQVCDYTARGHNLNF